jgi:hypothetical protein
MGSEEEQAALYGMTVRDVVVTPLGGGEPYALAGPVTYFVQQEDLADFRGSDDRVLWTARTITLNLGVPLTFAGRRWFDRLWQAMIAVAEEERALEEWDNEGGAGCR